MYLERVSEQNRDLFERAFALYESAFPYAERRDGAEQARILQKSDYHADLILRDGELLGILFYWEIEDFIYLEHLATLPEVRNQGVGAEALRLLKEKGRTVLLEIEPPIDELTVRRYGFYRRNGFLMTPHRHIQAKYHVEDGDLELKILSYPEVLTEDRYRRFRDYMTREIDVRSPR